MHPSLPLDLGACQIVKSCGEATLKAKAELCGTAVGPSADKYSLATRFHSAPCFNACEANYAAGADRSARKTSSTRLEAPVLLNTS